MQRGSDQKGTFYSSVKQMWQEEINSKQQHPSFISNDKIGSLANWYGRARKFWDNSTADYNGVLNGFGHLSQIDISGSNKFLRQYINKYPEFKCGRVLDCGAGIGRIAKQMLCNIFDKVDLIDQCQNYINEAKKLLYDKNIGHFYAQGLQDFEFEEKYDCIWIQWVLAHLTDNDAEIFLKKAKSSLNQNGIIVVKENHSDEYFLVDKEDCSISRSTALYKQLFTKVDLQIILEGTQQNWPEDLQAVRLYVLKQL